MHKAPISLTFTYLYAIIIISFHDIYSEKNPLPGKAEMSGLWRQRRLCVGSDMFQLCRVRTPEGIEYSTTPEWKMSFVVLSL